MFSETFGINFIITHIAIILKWENIQKQKPQFFSCLLTGAENAKQNYNFGLHTCTHSKPVIF